MAKKRKAPSPAQLANQRRFAEMARARSRKVGAAVRSAAQRSAGFGRSSSGGGGMLAGIPAVVIGGGMDAAWIVGGKVVSRAVPNVLKMSTVDETGAPSKSKELTVAGVQLAAGLAAAIAASRFISRDAGRLVFAGAAVGLLESAARRFQVPYVSTLVGDEGDALAAGGFIYEIQDGQPVGMYPGGGPGVGMYPQSLGLYPGSGNLGSYVFE